MKRSNVAIPALMFIMLIAATTSLTSESPPEVRIMGVPRNGNLTKSKVCPPGSLPCDNDCQWNLSFSAEIRSDKGISSTQGRVEYVDQPVTNDPPLKSCDSGPVKRTVTTFTRDFAVSCPGVKNGCTTEIFPIDFAGYDCEGNGGFAYMRLILKCYYCSNDAFVAVDGNGLTELGYAGYDRNVAIQFVVLNLKENTITANLTSLETLPWPYDPPFPPSIELGPGESREFFVNVTVPAVIVPGMENIFTLNADAVDGLWVSDSDTILVKEYTSVDEDIAVPPVLYLSQNYPNPFNPSTEIKYYLPGKSQVALEIFDISGKRMALVVRKEQEKGFHMVRWDGVDEQGNSVASGVYFCRLTAGKETISKKMILLR